MDIDPFWESAFLDIDISELQKLIDKDIEIHNQLMELYDILLIKERFGMLKPGQ